MSIGSESRARTGPRRFGTPWLTLAAVGICALVAGAVYESVSAPSAIWSPELVDHPGYSPADAPDLQEAWPAHLAALTSVASGLGAIAAALVVVSVRLAGGSIVAGMVAGLGLAFGSIFWSRAASDHPATVAAGLALLTMAALVWPRARDVASARVLTSAIYGLAVLAQPALLAVLPVVTWANTPRSGSGLRRAAIAAATAVVGVAAFVSARAWLLGSPPGTLWVASVRDVGTRAAQLPTALVAEFGVLGLALGACGVFTLAVRRPETLAVVAGWSSLATIGGLAWAAPDWRGTILPAVACGWLLVGAGVEWLLTESGLRRTAAVAIAALLPAMSFAGHYWAGARGATAREFTERYLLSLDRVVPEHAVIVAEDGLVDRLAAAAADAGVLPFERTAQDPARIQAHLAAGRPVVAFGRARRNLSELGFRFQPAGAGVSMSIEEWLATIPSGWVVAMAAGPDFGRWLPERDGDGLAPIGGSWRHFGSRLRYGLIGVHGGGEAVELTGADVAIGVKAGDEASPRYRWPANVRVVSDGLGAVVEYDGTPVATSTSGLAVAVLSGSGALVGAYSTEASEQFRIRMSPVGLEAGVVVGREPCAAVGDDAWVDVTRQAAFSSIGAIVETGQHLRVYAAGRGLSPHQRALRRGLAGVTVEHFDLARPDDRRALAAALAADGVIDSSGLAAATHVVRLDVAAAPRRRAQAAIRLGGSASAAVARLVKGGASTRVLVCSAMRGGAGLFVDGSRGPHVESLDLASVDLLPRGWDRLEFNGARSRRWTRTRTAEVLVPLARTPPIELELEIEPASPEGTTVALQINSRRLPEVYLAPGLQTLRVRVPDDAWRTGMNRLEITAGTLYRPADHGQSRDERALGVAVSAVRLRAVEFDAGGGAR